MCTQYAPLMRTYSYFSNLTILLLYIGPVNIGKFGSPQRREVEMLWLALRDAIAAKRGGAPGFGQR